MIRALVLTSTALLLTVVSACGNDAAGTTDDAATDATSASATEPTTGTTAAPEPFEPMLALGGLELDWVEANQGVGVAIGRDGAGVGGPDRTSYLIQDRITLIRAFWKDLPADWVPRKIEGRLIVSYPDGSEKVLKNTPLVEGASFIGDLKQSFFWGLMAPEVTPGIKFRIELFETEAGFALLPEGAAPGPVAPKLPLSGNAYVGIEDSNQALKVTLVPFNYDDGQGCKTSPDTSDATMQLFQDSIYMMNPVDTLEFTLHAPIDWLEPLSDFNELNAFMSGTLRQQENAPENMYYYGLVDVCSGGLGGAGGKAFGIPLNARKSDAFQRVSSGLSLDPEWSAETFVHEVGHTQGRFHIRCQGEAGTDDTYPNTGGVIGEWGFGVVNFKLYHPTVHKDYMTYCHPVWASTFAWNKTYPNIKTLTSWDTAGAPKDEPIGPLLVGSIYPSGKETWITVHGGIDPQQLSAVHSIEFQAGGTTLVREQAAYIPQSEGDTFLIVAPLPKDFEAVTQIVHVAGERRTATPVKAISQGHRYRLAAK